MTRTRIGSSFPRRSSRSLIALTAATSLMLLSVGPASASSSSGHSLPPTTHFALHKPDKAAVQQVGQLFSQRNVKGADQVADELLTPQADWITKGTPAQVRRQVAQLVTVDNILRTVPTLVVYYVPGRDCSQYSSGGAPTDAAYRTWVDSFVKGLGHGKAVVVVEPDGLANLPSNCPTAYPGQDIAALTASRLSDIKYAADALETDPNASVYLDAGNSAWQNVGEIANRLTEAGVNDVQGFSLNVSNYQYTANSNLYGAWVSECLAYTTTISPGAFGDCPNQYWNGGPSNNWTGVALDRYGVWSDTATADQIHYTGAITERYATMLNGLTPTAHYVVDTSRNGTGPNDIAEYAAAPYNQSAAIITGLQSGNWCNPPGAGNGLKPTASTGVALADAYLWVKNPGESDGQCNIAGGARAWDYTAYNPWSWNATQQANNDPLWGVADPAAGGWFPQAALQLAQNAVHRPRP